MTAVATAAVTLALVLDLLVAEFPERVHPVVFFGRLVSLFDRTWEYPLVTGTLVALALPVIVAGLIGRLIEITIRVNPVAGTVIAGLALFSTTSLRMLVEIARTVIELTASDLDRARKEVRALVGRDATALSPGELRSGAVESVAENLADGLVAPLLAFAVGAHVSISLAVGVAVWVKAVNTLDSMLGYESKPVGWASARLDDVVMWLPARISAVLIAVATLDLSALFRARRWVQAPPSPNSGWPMATLAVALNVQLTKPSVYTLNPAGQPPTVTQARRGVRIVGIAGLLAFLGTGVVAWS